MTSPGLDAVEALTAAAQNDVDSRRKRLSGQRGSEITQVHGLTADRTLAGAGQHFHPHGRGPRSLQPEQRIEQADSHGFGDACPGAGNRHRLGHRLGRARHRALGAGHLDRLWIGRHGPDDESWRRIAFDLGDNRHRARRRLLELHRDAARGHLNDLHTERHPHVLRSQLKEPATRPRGTQIEHRDDISGRHLADGSRAPAHAHVDEREGLAGQLEPRRKLLQLERHAQAAFDDLFAGHGHPERHGERQRDDLEAGMAKRPHRNELHQAPARVMTCTGRARTPAPCGRLPAK